jgi:hypothetical protein
VLFKQVGGPIQDSGAIPGGSAIPGDLTGDSLIERSIHVLEA